MHDLSQQLPELLRSELRLIEPGLRGRRGRPVWKLRPIQLLITVICIALIAAALIILALFGPVAASIGSGIGVTDTVVTAWGIAKWPVLALVAVVVVALLSYATPTPSSRSSAGSRWAPSLLAGAPASFAFQFYVANFSSYNKTYGSLASVVIPLLSYGSSTSHCSSGPNSTPSSSAAGSYRPAATDVALGRKIREQASTTTSRTPSLPRRKRGLRRRLLTSARPWSLRYRSAFGRLSRLPLPKSR